MELIDLSGKQDLARVAHWFRMAAGLDHPQAQSMLGYLYQNCLGVPKDIAEAMRWYLRAAEQGNAEARSQLGLFYETGQGGVARDLTEAADWYQRAENGGIKTNPERELFFWPERLRSAEDAEDADDEAVLEALWNVALVLTRDPEFQSPYSSKRHARPFAAAPGLAGGSSARIIHDLSNSLAVMPWRCITPDATMKRLN